jgi:hypothetical protein
LAAIRTDLDHDAFASLRAFAQLARGRQGPIKWQLTGPITLGLALVREGVLASEAFDVAGRAVLLRLRVVQKFLTEALPACPQVVLVDEPGRSLQRSDVEDVLGLVLRERSTPVQYLLHTSYPRPLVSLNEGSSNDRGAT